MSHNVTIVTKILKYYFEENFIEMYNYLKKTYDTMLVSCFMLFFSYTSKILHVWLFIPVSLFLSQWT